jgi:cytidylate kinase
MRPPHRLIIAIDGPAGAGKSTVARCVAQRLGYRYLDTGAMYRTIALKALRKGLNLADQQALSQAAEDAKIQLKTEEDATRVWLDGVEVTGEIRNPEVTEAASRVSVVPRVRQAMVRQQRGWGEQGGVVMEGLAVSTETVRQELAARDARDAARPASPLVRAPDAVLVQTDGLSPDAVVEQILQICRRKGAGA